MNENKVVETPAQNNTSTESRQQPKFRISLKLMLILIPLALIITATSLYYLKIMIGKIQDRNISFDKEENITQQIQVQDEWKAHDDVQGNFRIKFPPYATLEVRDEETNARTITVTSKGSKQTTDLDSEYDLQDGYIFKIIYNTVEDSLDTSLLANRKKDSYRLECSELYSNTTTEKTTISSLEAYSFTIQNCPQNIRDIFLKVNNRLYEIILVHRGDIGYKEKYEQDLNEILNSLTILNKDDYENPDAVVYSNKESGFSLEHPNLDSTCCNIDLSLFTNARKTVVLADKQTYLESAKREFNGIAIYIDNNTDGLSIESYIDNQKNMLLTDYKIITGKNPETSQENIKLDGVDAVLLKGYAWWGDIVFVKHPTTSKILIISKLHTQVNSFDTEFREILKTLKFISTK